MLTQALLKKLLEYDPETGVFTWKVATSNRVKVGDVAGCKNPDGYIVIRIDRKHYQAHRLSWLFVNGYFPEYQIDHINGVRDDNRLCNLRESTNVCNMQNCKMSKNNTTGIPGVSRYKAAGKYQAQIMINGKRKHLGFYRNIVNAALARFTIEQQCPDWHCDAQNSTKQAIDRKFPGLLKNY